MARTYTNFKQNLNESDQRLLEIGQRVHPYKTNFAFTDSGDAVFTNFIDAHDNKIDCLFHRFSKGSSCYEVEFTINNQSFDAINTDTQHFFKIISTVIETVNEFIAQYQPEQLFIAAVDKPGKEGQKIKIWLQYAKVNLDADGYVIGNHKNGFGIQKR